MHPEAYPLVEKILSDHNMAIPQVIGNRDLLQSINAANYVDDRYGLPTIRDILQELEKPGRDPRPEFKTACFKEGVEDIKDLEPGMILEGVVSNVTNFGAFVDIGVHQDGLVHISAMTHRFISDPHAIVKTGDIVTVKIVDVDKERRRIGLTMKLEDQQPQKSKPVVAERPKKQATHHKPVSDKKPTVKKPAVTPAPKKTIFNTSMADALAKLKRGSDS